jgi:hypothetical protein
MIAALSMEIRKKVGRSKAGCRVVRRRRGSISVRRPRPLGESRHDHGRGRADKGVVAFDDQLATRLDEADKIYNGINAAIDKYIEEKGFDAPPPSVYEPVWRPDAPGTSFDLAAEGVTSIIWCIGFRPDFCGLDAPVFNGRGQPQHYRGVTNVPGVYFLGLPWMHTWGSGCREPSWLENAFAVKSIS